MQDSDLGAIAYKTQSSFFLLLSGFQSQDVPIYGKLFLIQKSIKPKSIHITYVIYLKKSKMLFPRQSLKIKD